jgi:NADH-quinone oxidoreductase subunit C
MTNDELKDYIAIKFGDRMTLLHTGRGCPLYEVKADDLLEVARALKEDEELTFDYLCNIGGVDTGERLEMIYNITSISKLHRLDFKVILSSDNPSIESVQQIWPAANWYEREAWELYGFEIKNHDNLTRFLLPDDWDQGHPMRKGWTAPDFIPLPEFNQ